VTYSALAVAAVVLASALVAGGCGLIGVGGGGEGQHFTAYFTRTISLYPQSDVRILGLHAGRVRNIKVVGTRVKVDFTIDAETPVPADVHATIVPLSLIGERYLQLFPAWTGGAKLAEGATIPLERTTVPVEPDEALESLRNLLDHLNPDGARRLVTNLAEDVQGQGQVLNDALHQFAGLTTTLADKSDAIGAIIDRFDDFTATLVTRERALGQVMDDFATLTDVLADERKHVESLVHNLATVAGTARDLVATHKAGLDRDLTTLGKVAKAIDVNIGSIEQFLDSGPVLADGLQRAYNPTFHRIDLRNSFSPTAAQAVSAALGPLAPSPLTQICLPIDVDCTPVPAPAAASQPRTNATDGNGAAVPPTTGTTIVPKPSNPTDELNNILKGLQARSGRRERSSLVPSASVGRVLGGAFRRAASHFVGVLR